MILMAATRFALTLSVGNQWPEFRGPSHQGVSVATNIPVHWSSTENIAWTRPLLGSGWSSPSIANNVLYLSSATGDGKSDPLALAVSAYSTHDGTELWRTPVLPRGTSPLPSIHDKNGKASPTILVDSSRQRLFAHFGHLGTVALDSQGRLLWEQTTLGYTPIHGNGGSPALVDETLLFSCDGGSDPFVVGLDANTGKVRWKTPRRTSAKRTFSFSTPLAVTVDGATQVILTGSGFVGAYNPITGSELWRVNYGEGYSVIPRPVFADGLLFIGTGYDAPTLLAINPSKASGDATSTAIAWRINKGAPNTPSVVVHNGYLFFVSDAGIASCAESATGKILWNERLGGGFSASPILAEGRLYFINEEGITTVINASSTFQILSRNDLKERVLASLGVIDNALFIRTRTQLLRIGSKPKI